MQSMRIVVENHAFKGSEICIKGWTNSHSKKIRSESDKYVAWKKYYDFRSVAKLCNARGLIGLSTEINE